MGRIEKEECERERVKEEDERVNGDGKRDGCRLVGLRKRREKR